jgi:ABC-type antimicrobial peptide transport system permease subunit
LFLREAVLLVAFGAVIGFPLALALWKPLNSLLYEVPSADPIGIGITMLLIVLGSLAASVIPARRATRVNPVEALRYE